MMLANCLPRCPFRSILSENPTHLDALHLLGVIFFQKGDVLAALPYVGQAMMLSNSSVEEFLNTLGALCSTSVLFVVVDE